MKSFYRPKKSAGITKPKPPPSISSKKKALPTHDVVLGSPAAQSAALLSHIKPNLRGAFRNGCVYNVEAEGKQNGSPNSKIIKFAWFDLNALIWGWKLGKLSSGFLLDSLLDTHPFGCIKCSNDQQRRRILFL